MQLVRKKLKQTLAKYKTDEKSSNKRRPAEVVCQGVYSFIIRNGDGYSRMHALSASGS